MSRAALKPMRANKWGRIVSVSSLAGRTGYARQAAYSASKAGIIGMTRSIAHDVARQGITVNAVCPGWIRTSRSLNSARRVSADVEAELQRRAERVPIGRLGVPADVAATIVFLASEGAGYLTGQVLDVDGGLLMS
jgi:3-oxoacyl-[acyl-carrier protein] reductase